MVLEQPSSLSDLSAEELRELTGRLLVEVRHKQALIDKLTHENAVLKRLKFATQSERYGGEQKSLLEETLDADLQAVSEEIEQLNAPKASQPERSQPKRQPLPAQLPRREIRHEPDSTTCACGCQMKRIGEDIAEKLDYQPGVFTVERHVRGKWACARCQSLIQAPVEAHVIDKGIPTAALLAQVLVAKYADHLPLYRQEAIFGRAGFAIPRSTLAQWVGSCGVRLQPLADALRQEILTHRVLHADETPVQMLQPGSGKTHRAYLWAYAPGAFEDMRAVVYDFCDSRAGEHARAFLGEWTGSLVCDDYAGYVAAKVMCSCRIHFLPILYGASIAAHISSGQHHATTVAGSPLPPVSAVVVPAPAARRYRCRPRPWPSSRGQPRRRCWSCQATHVPAMLGSC
jgi:transposase